MCRRTCEPSAPPSRLPHGLPSHMSALRIAVVGIVDTRAMGTIRNPRAPSARTPPYHLLLATIASTTAMRTSDTTSQHHLTHLHVPTSHFRPGKPGMYTHSNQRLERSSKACQVLSHRCRSDVNHRETSNPSQPQDTDPHKQVLDHQIRGASKR